MSIKSYLCRLLGCPTVKPTFKKYGWKKQLPDHRDIKFKLDRTITDNLPTSIDARKSGFMPHVYDQGSLGSCTANSIAAALEFDRAKQGLEVWTPSRLFIYYYERLGEGTVNSDSGAMIRDGYKVINTTGYAKETTWPYVTGRFTMAPSEAAMAEAATNKSVQYQSVDQTETAIKTVLAQGYVISFGISVYASFEGRDVAANGFVPLPHTSEKNLGGHAILLVGYDDNRKVYIFRNSWGKDWGDGGYGYLPYAYVHNENLASDFWVVESVS
jgi:C1A family cysteine protease